MSRRELPPQDSGTAARFPRDSANSKGPILVAATTRQDRQSETRQLQRGLLSAFPDRALGIGGQLLVLPLIARNLTPSEFGLLLAITATIGIVSVLNVGQGPALSIVLAQSKQAHSTGDGSADARTLASAQAVLILLSFAILVSLSAFLAVSNLQFLGQARFAVSPGALTGAAAVLLGSASISVIFSWAPALRAANLEQHLSHQVGTVFKAISLLVLAAVLLVRPSFLAILVARQAIPALAPLADALLIRRRDGIRLFPRRLPDKSIASRLVRSNTLHSLAQFGGAFSAGIVVSVAVSEFRPGPSATLGILFAGLAIFQSLSWAYNGQLLVSVGRRSNQDADGGLLPIFRRALLVHSVLTASFVAACISLAIFPSVLQVLFGSSYEASLPLVIAVSATAICSSLEGVHYATMMGAGRELSGALPIVLRGGALILALGLGAGQGISIDQLAFLFLASFLVLTPYYFASLAWFLRSQQVQTL